jgi:hypothetical protein
MLSQGVHKFIPFFLWDDFLCFVVGEKALVLHVDFLDEICAVIFGFSRASFSVAAAVPSLRLSISIVIRRLRWEKQTLGFVIMW